MIAKICASLEELNELIKDKKKIDVRFHSQIVGSKKDASGQEQLIVADRFLVLIEEK